jgi:hypothetical protein
MQFQSRGGRGDLLVERAEGSVRYRDLARVLGGARRSPRAAAELNTGASACNRLR